MKPVQSLKIKLHFPEYSHWHFGNKKHTPVLLKIHQGKPPDCSDVAAFRWKDGRARQSCGQVSSYLGAKQSILVHKNEGMRVPMAARGYEWMVICELACWDICGVCQCSVGKIGRAMWTEPGSKSWHFSFFFHEIGKILQNFLKATSPESSSHIVTPWLCLQICGVSSSGRTWLLITRVERARKAWGNRGDSLPGNWDARSPEPARVKENSCLPRVGNAFKLFSDGLGFTTSTEYFPSAFGFSSHCG